MRKKHGAQMAGPWLIPKGQGPHWHTPNIATTPPTRLSRVYHALVDFQPISHSDLSSCPVVIPKVSKKKKKRRLSAPSSGLSVDRRKFIGAIKLSLISAVRPFNHWSLVLTLYGGRHLETFEVSSA